jgi:hypothetical protein
MVETIERILNDLERVSLPWKEPVVQIILMLHGVVGVPEHVSPSGPRILDVYDPERIVPHVFIFIYPDMPTWESLKELLGRALFCAR